MRRQARISAGGALVVRSASALQVWLWLLIFIFQNEFRIADAIQPGYLDFDNLPETNFTCAGKVIGGYYADLETSCQMFHVCTVGSENETMDIKFLCLNGTVFDQETRVCERVDEVDCTKSEKFYSLNLELYGSLAPPIIQPEQVRPHTTSTTTERTVKVTKPNVEVKTDPSIEESPTTSQEKIQLHSTETVDSTEDPIHDKKGEPENPHTVYIQQAPEHTGTGEDDVIYSENPEYEDEYTHSPPTTPSSSTTTTTTTTTTTRKPTTTTTTTTTTTRYPTIIPHHISSSPFYLPSTTQPALSTINSPETSSMIDPAILSPEEFTYHHRGPSSEAISFQRQSARPADGIYITHAPPNQYDHFQYESSRTAPRPAASRPGGYVPRPQPSPFRTTTIDPRDQLLRPVPTSQPSDRYNRHHPVQPPQQLPYDTYYYEPSKRSDDTSVETVLENESFLTARSVAPPTITERRPFKPKSPPRVIVTASASVSDSNGRRLNYTVGNVVSAVKPIAQVNYDDYKESDFDPFFLDVPKLQKRRKSRSNINNRLITIPATTISTSLMSKNTATLSTIISQVTTTKTLPTTRSSAITTTPAWNPNDYVDDNYEPHAYIPPAHPLAVLMPQVRNINLIDDRQLANTIVVVDVLKKQRNSDNLVDQTKPTTSVAQTTSSHSFEEETTVASEGFVSPLQSPRYAKARRRRSASIFSFNKKFTDTL